MLKLGVYWTIRIYIDFDFMLGGAGLDRKRRCEESFEFGGQGSEDGRFFAEHTFPSFRRLRKRDGGTHKRRKG